MKKLNYLSKDFIELDSIMSRKVFVDFSQFKAEMNWDDCLISCLEAGNSWNYYKINFQKGKVIAVGKDSHCQIRKIENGLFKGCYCVIEAKKNENSFTILYIFDRTKILRYPEFKQFMSAEQVDLLLSQKQVEKMSAEILNQFDVLKRVQDYEIFFENLPNNVWKQKDFAKNVLRRFEEMGDVKLQTEIDKKFVKLDLCKEISRKYFNDLSKKKEQGRTL